MTSLHFVYYAFCLISGIQGVIVQLTSHWVSAARHRRGSAVELRGIDRLRLINKGRVLEHSKLSHVRSFCGNPNDYNRWTFGEKTSRINPIFEGSTTNMGDVYAVFYWTCTCRRQDVLNQEKYLPWHVGRTWHSMTSRPTMSVFEPSWQWSCTSNCDCRRSLHFLVPIQLGHEAHHIDASHPRPTTNRKDGWRS